MVDQSHLYLVSESGDFFWYSLDEENQLRLQSVCKLSMYCVCCGVDLYYYILLLAWNSYNPNHHSSQYHL